MSAWKPLLSKNLRELRFVMCFKSPSSQGLRNYIYKNYPQLKDMHPYFPFYVRECENAEANILARYSYGVERRKVVENCTEDEIDKALEELVTISKGLDQPLKQDANKML